MVRDFETPFESVEQPSAVRRDAEQAPSSQDRLLRTSDQKLEAARAEENEALTSEFVASLVPAQPSSRGRILSKHAYYTAQ